MYYTNIGICYINPTLENVRWAKIETGEDYNTRNWEVSALQNFAFV